MHRDISTGNLLYAMNSGNKLKYYLADLEYAKKMDNTGTAHDIRTVSHILRAGGTNVH